VKCDGYDCDLIGLATPATLGLGFQERKALLEGRYGVGIGIFALSGYLNSKSGYV
jgi:hypothetical protein